MCFAHICDLMSYWADVPPAHVALKQISLFLGAAAKGPEAAPEDLARQVQSAGSSPSAQGNVADLLSLFPGGTITV